MSSARAPGRQQAAIYESRAEEYHRLVLAEDADGRLLPAIRERVELEGRRVVEVGAGTGRLTRLLRQAGAAQIRAFDRAPAMLEVARRYVPEISFETADARSLPLPDASADVLVAGWVFGHLRVWMPEGWEAELDACLDEARRVLAPGGRTLIIETLGTGTAEAAPPSPALAEYYRLLEARGFVRSQIPTDYVFATAREAASVLGGFFGPAMAERIERENWARVPEWTGLWVR